MTQAIDPAAAKAFVEGAWNKIDEVVAKLDALPKEQRTQVVIPAVTVGRGPDGDIPPAAAAEPPAAAAEPPPERSDAEVFARVAAFLDPLQLGPLFVSKPIRRRVYFGVYPSFAEYLSTDKIIGPEPSGLNGGASAMWEAAGMLGVVIRGWLFEGDPRIEHVLAHAGDPSKWPPMQPLTFARNRDPYLFEDTVALYKQYLAWKIDVTPTDAELEKYYGRPS